MDNKVKLYASIKAIEVYLPKKVRSNQDIEQKFPEWTADKIEEKTGVSIRHIAEETEFASDLGVKAALKLFEKGICKPEDIDYLIFCTQSPDYLLPSSSCIIQERLSLRTDCGALDINLGCSGFVYGLSLAKALLQTHQFRNVLLITADTYSKFINENDKANLTLFGDGAAATLLTASTKNNIGPFVFGTDGKGKDNLIVPVGGVRYPTKDKYPPNDTLHFSPDYLFMNGGEIFNFTINTIPKSVNKLLEKANITIDRIDKFVFHQANKFILNHLRHKLRIDTDKFIINMKNTGNTVSSTIPIALKNAYQYGRVHRNETIMILGFGVGYSWAGSLLKLDEEWQDV
jgi:3-oxoacyl-[acyl-carrier-protein] synthase-3